LKAEWHIQTLNLTRQAQRIFACLVFYWSHTQNILIVWSLICHTLRMFAICAINDHLCELRVLQLLPMERTHSSHMLP
jgi:hypothetical protein